MYCVDADTIINIELAGWFDKLSDAVKNNYVCFPEGVYRQLTDTSTKIGNKVKLWDKYKAIHYLTTNEKDTMKKVDLKYGPQFSIGNIKYQGFWKTELPGGGVDAQVVAVAKEENHIAVTNDKCIHGACMLENVECIRFEEFGRRLVNNTLVQLKMFNS